MYTLEDVHHYNNLLLEEVDRLCKKHNLKYFMDSGTLIGAVRHKGNIPWDDDVDIAMPRKDYEQFIRLCEQGELSEGYELVRPQDYGENHFFDFITHIAYTKSSVRPDEGEMAFYNGKMNHLLLDIFVLDEISPHPLAQKLHIANLYLIYMLSWAHRYHLDYEKYTPAQRIVVWLMSHIGKMFRQSSLNRAFERTAQRHNNKGYQKLHSAYYILEQLSCIYDAAWYGEAVRMPVDEFYFDAPVGYDQVLRTMYGNYMELPPKEKRVAEHYDVTSRYFHIER